MCTIMSPQDVQHVHQNKPSTCMSSATLNLHWTNKNIMKQKYNTTQQMKKIADSI